MSRQRPIILPIAALLLGAAAHIWDPPPLAYARSLTFDLYQNLRPRPYEPVPVRVVDIDDESLARIGQWPWPRDVVARVVDRVIEAGAATVVLDVIFAEPDAKSPARMIESLRDLPEPMRPWARTLPDNDRLLAESIARGPVVAAFALTADPGGTPPKIKNGWALAGDKPAPWVPSFEGSIKNLALIEDVALGNGSANLDPDRDHVVRRIPFILRLGDQLYPSLVAEAARVATGASTYLVRSSNANGIQALGAKSGIAEIRIGKLRVPTDANGHIVLYDSGPVPERTVPAWRLLASKEDPGLHGTVVLIGVGATALSDISPTPIRAAVPGVEIHAQAIEQLISGQILQRPDWASGAELAFLALTGLAMIVLLPYVGAFWGAAIGGTAVAGAAATSWHAFAAYGLLLGPVYPALAALLVWMTTSLLLHHREETARRVVTNAFGRYVSPVIVEQLALHPEQLKLGGERRNMTFLFCDIRDFTTISECFQEEPEQLIALVNRFLTPMTEVIQQRGGTIDKYIGDCIMAFWNAPLADANHAPNACDAALSIMDALETLNAEIAADKELMHVLKEGRLRVGIGLNTGPCFVGNMGSKTRFDYSAIGDAVNSASRLEGLTKTYGVNIILGEETARRAARYAIIEIDVVALRGKHHESKVYALLGPPARAETPGFDELAAIQRKLVAALATHDWDAADHLLQQARVLAPDLSTLHAVYAERITAGRRMASPDTGLPPDARLPVTAAAPT